MTLVDKLIKSIVVQVENINNTAHDSFRMR